MINITMQSLSLQVLFERFQ